jgi:hypothetical protein
VRLGIVTVDKVRKYLVDGPPGVVVAVVLCRPSGWTLVAVGLALFAYSLLREHLTRRTLLVILNHAPAGTTVSLPASVGENGIQVTIGGRGNPPDKAERGTATEPE